MDALVQARARIMDEQNYQPPWPDENWYDQQDEEVATALTVMEALGGDWFGPFGFISFDDQMTW